MHTSRLGRQLMRCCAEPIGLHGPLPPPGTKFLRPREEWAGLAEAKATKWFTNHRGKPGLALLEDDYLFHNPDDPCIVPYLPPGHSTTTDRRPAILIMPGGGYHWLAPFEGPPIGQWCGEHGMVGFVLRYRLLREDAAGESIGYTRDHAVEDAVAVMLAVGETVILLHPPLPSVGVSIWTERERQQNNAERGRQQNDAGASLQRKLTRCAYSCNPY